AGAHRRRCGTSAPFQPSQAPRGLFVAKNDRVGIGRGILPVGMSERLPSQNGLPSRRLGRYELIAEIASGGMGTVLLARLEGVGGFQRLVAVKLLHEHHLDDV